MGVVKSITRSTAAQRVICGVLAFYMRLLGWTGRWKILGQELPEKWLAERKPFIVAFWHGRLLMMFLAWRYPDRVHVLISGHRDGQLISRSISHFGAKTVVGSKRRGGAGAALEIVRLLHRGEVIAVTPDGPRGPRMRAKEGIISLAVMGGVPIIPLTYACRPRKVFSSWDRFNLPLPFCRGVFIWGDPIDVPKTADAAMKEEKRLLLEGALQEITDRADDLLGNPATEPAPPESAQVGSSQ